MHTSGLASITANARGRNGRNVPRYEPLLSLCVRLRAEPGQTMAEYGILVAVIAIVVIAAAMLLGGSIASLFGNNASHI